MERLLKVKEKNGKKYFFRFTVQQRVQHLILASMVITLALTGMPLRFKDTPWAPHLYSFLGGIKYAPIIHKTAGTILMLLFVYHIFYLAWNFLFGRVLPLKRTEGLSLVKLIKLFLRQPMIPTLKDAKDILGLLKYLFFLTDRRPDGAEWTWKEKADYWAPFWGAPILGLTGLMMWQKELVTKILPGEILNYALIAHSDEALLAVLFLFIWHWYNVHFSTSVFPMGTAFLTGYLSEAIMVEEHYDYYVKVMKEAGFENEILPPHGARDRESVQKRYDAYDVEAMEEEGLEDKAFSPKVSPAYKSQEGRQYK